MTTNHFNLERALTDDAYRAGLSPAQQASLPRVVNGDDLNTRGEFDPLGLPHGVDSPIVTDTGLVPIDATEAMAGDVPFDDPSPVFETDSIYVGC